MGVRLDKFEAWAALPVTVLPTAFEGLGWPGGCGNLEAELLSLHLSLSQTITWNIRYHAVLLSLKHHSVGEVEFTEGCPLARLRIGSLLMCDSHRVTLSKVHWQLENVFEIAEPLDQVLLPPPLSRVLLEVPLPTSGVPDSTKDRRTSSPYMLPLVTSSLVVVGPPFLSCS